MGIASFGMNGDGDDNDGHGLSGVIRRMMMKEHRVLDKVGACMGFMLY